MSVTVYSKPNCPQCTSTKTMLANAGIEYSEIDITQDDDAFMHVTQDLNLRTMPAVETPDGYWGGHDEEKIAALISGK